MDLDGYAAKYGGAQGELLRDLARIKGNHYANAEYRRAAAAALEGFGIERSDAREISRGLKAEQVRRLGEHVAAQEEEGER